MRFKNGKILKYQDAQENKMPRCPARCTDVTRDAQEKSLDVTWEKSRSASISESHKIIDTRLQHALTKHKGNKKDKDQKYQRSWELNKIYLYKF